MTLQLTKDWPQTYSQRYLGRIGRDTLEERLLREIGPTALQRGSLTLDELLAIGKWKSNRATGHLKKNDSESVRMVTEAALNGSDALAVHTLTILNGVADPMASAVMTILRPAEFTVIDIYARRTLKAAGIKLEPSLGKSDYWPYLRRCRALATDLDTDLRTLDRAMWEWGESSTGS